MSLEEKNKIIIPGEVTSGILEGIEDGSLTVTGTSVIDEGIGIKIEGFKWHPDYVTKVIEGKK